MNPLHLCFGLASWYWVQREVQRIAVSSETVLANLNWAAMVMSLIISLLLYHHTFFLFSKEYCPLLIFGSNVRP